MTSNTSCSQQVESDVGKRDDPVFCSQLNNTPWCFNGSLDDSISEFLPAANQANRNNRRANQWKPAAHMCARMHISFKFIQRGVCWKPVVDRGQEEGIAIYNKIAPTTYVQFALAQTYRLQAAAEAILADFVTLQNRTQYAYNCAIWL